MATKFNPEGKEKLTYGEALGTAMSITDPEDAKQYFEAYVDFMVKHSSIKKREAIEIAKSNLGYYAGYYDNETRERVERLFCCAHPVFGSIAANGAPTPEQAYDIGVKMGEKLRKKSKR